MTPSGASAPRLSRILLAALALLAAAPAFAREPSASFAPVLSRAEPAVVNVTTASGVGEDDGEPVTLQDLFRRLLGEEPSSRPSLGSGFIVSEAGEIVTNAHVVRGVDHIRVRLATDEELEARLVGADEATDLALLRVQASRPLPALPLGDSDALAVGDWVLALGNPLGLTPTATAGIVSAKGRLLGSGAVADFIQTDLRISPGSSGGPLVDEEGRVVGVNVAVASESGADTGIGFAIPINMARGVIEQLRAHGRVIRGWIGVATQGITPDLAQPFGLSAPRGALVADVTPEGPAAAAGIVRGDVIVRWGERELHRARGLPALIAATPPGTKVPVTIVRDGREYSVDVTVDEIPATPEPAPSPTAAEEWGLLVEPLSPTEARRRGLEPAAGLLVVDVVEGGPAEEAGLEPGDVVLEAARRPVRSATEFWEALAAHPEHILLRLRRGTSSMYVELRR